MRFQGFISKKKDFKGSYLIVLIIGINNKKKDKRVPTPNQDSLVKNQNRDKTYGTIGPNTISCQSLNFQTKTDPPTVF